MSDELPEWDDVSVYYDSADRRWIAAIALGYDSSGRRLRKKLKSSRSCRGRKAATADLKKRFDGYRDELASRIVTPADYTIRQCVEDWLATLDLDEETIAEYRGQARKWIYERIGARKLKRFRAADAQGFFNDISVHLGK